VGDVERTWAKRDEFAKQAMAQTRAISRACRSERPERSHYAGLPGHIGDQLRGSDDAGDVAVPDQHDPRSGGAHIGDQLLVAQLAERQGARPALLLVARASGALAALLLSGTKSAPSQ
jgi:hypothetical protein